MADGRKRRVTAWKMKSMATRGDMATVTSRIYSGRARAKRRATSTEVAASGMVIALYCAPSGRKIMLSISTAMTGPMLHMATRPKLSLWESLSLRSIERPMPIAIIKGTVMGPVVTPPESKASGMKSPGAKAARTNISG